jgi:hypothetical protein
MTQFSYFNTRTLRDWAAVKGNSRSGTEKLEIPRPRGARMLSQG